MAFADVRSELSCSVCREIYTDPVTLPCGHNFCRVCIERTWEEQIQYLGEDPSCPDCRRTYRRRPELNRNHKLCNIAYHFHSTDPKHDWDEISCTYCDNFVPASRSCLRCEASLCHFHLLKHSKSEKHILVDPTKPERGQCPVHRKNLEFYCTDDGAGLCVSCWLDKEHRGHRVELLNETEEQIQRLQMRHREAQEKATDETERILEMFQHIREELEALEMRLLSDVSKHNEKVSLGLCDEMKHLQIRTLPLRPRKFHHKTRSRAGGSESGQFRIKESESETDPDLWSLISKKLLSGLDEIVAAVKQKIHKDVTGYKYHRPFRVTGCQPSLSAIRLGSTRRAQFFDTEERGNRFQPQVHIHKRKVPGQMEEDSASCHVVDDTASVSRSSLKTESKPSSQHVGIQCQPMMRSSSTQTTVIFPFSDFSSDEEDFFDFIWHSGPGSSDRFQTF